MGPLACRRDHGEEPCASAACRVVPEHDPAVAEGATPAVGERWALLVVRELSYGPKRFTDLRNGLAGASPNVLSQRLRELESMGVVRRQLRGTASYELTDWGRELHPILLQLGRWALARGGALPARSAWMR
jgi:DNA-binding HxlR family transcriptional regulator